MVVKGAFLVTLLWTLLGVAPAARAHISLERGGTHLSRYGEDHIKEGPCGLAGGGRGEHVYTYAPGETITLRFEEFVPHPGYFRVAFDADGDDDFADPVSIDPIDPNRGCPASGLPEEQRARDMCSGSDFYNNDAVLPGMDNLMPHVSAPEGMVYELEVTLPDVECDHCTLQLIQVMEDPTHGPYNLEVAGPFDTGDIYYQCIDLVLEAGSHVGAAGGAAEAPPTASGSGGDGGCAVHAAPAGGRIGLVLALALPLLRARRRRRVRPHSQPGSPGSSMHR